MIAGHVESPEINEASGLATSRQHNAVVYTINDSGDSARLFAIGLDGSTIGE